MPLSKRSRLRNDHNKSKTRKTVGKKVESVKKRRVKRSTHTKRSRHTVVGRRAKRVRRGGLVRNAQGKNFARPYFLQKPTEANPTNQSTKPADDEPEVRLSAGSVGSSSAGSSSAGSSSAGSSSAGSSSAGSSSAGSSSAGSVGSSAGSTGSLSASSADLSSAGSRLPPYRINLHRDNIQTVVSTGHCKNGTIRSSFRLGQNRQDEYIFEYTESTSQTQQRINLGKDLLGIKENTQGQITLCQKYSPISVYSFKTTLTSSEICNFNITPHPHEKHQVNSMFFGIMSDASTKPKCGYLTRGEFLKLLKESILCDLTTFSIFDRVDITQEEAQRQYNQEKADLAPNTVGLVKASGTTSDKNACSFNIYNNTIHFVQNQTPKHSIPLNERPAGNDVRPIITFSHIGQSVTIEDPYHKALLLTHTAFGTDQLLDFRLIDIQNPNQTNDDEQLRAQALQAARQVPKLVVEGWNTPIAEDISRDVHRYELMEGKEVNQRCVWRNLKGAPLGTQPSRAMYLYYGVHNESKGWFISDERDMNIGTVRGYVRSVTEALTPDRSSIWELPGDYEADSNFVANNAIKVRVVTDNGEWTRIGKEEDRLERQARDKVALLEQQAREAKVARSSPQTTYKQQDDMWHARQSNSEARDREAREAKEAQQKAREAKEAQQKARDQGHITRGQIKGTERSQTTFTGAATSAANAATSAAKAVTGAATSAANAVTGAATSAANAVTGAATSAANAVTGAATSAANAVTGIFPRPPSRERLHDLMRYKWENAHNIPGTTPTPYFYTPPKGHPHRAQHGGNRLVARHIRTRRHPKRRRAVGRRTRHTF